MNNKNENFWNKYYSGDNKFIDQNSSFADFVYENYIQEYNGKNVYLKICDLGCGNCRDTVYFCNKKNLCYGIDINGVIRQKQTDNCKLIKKDVNEVLKTFELRNLFDIMYMRWFLHALPYNISNDIFVNAVRNLKPNGLICIEVRSINDTELKQNSVYDKNDKSYKTNHKRWLFSVDMCKKFAIENDCDIIYCEEDYFSYNINTETPNPLLIRLVCRKRVLPYYERSEKYSTYKHIIPLMRSSIEHYSDMEVMNGILEKHNIKYVAVAGTVLGLTRHGGIIPWDNDIDIGFINQEWTKLMSIENELNKNGLNYTSNGPNHCHFGSIDCFKLIEKGNFYEGDAKTMCSKDEYKNVVKQPFGYSYVYSPFNSEKSLSKRYGERYFDQANVNDNYHFKDITVKNFQLSYNDRSYQLK